MKGGFMTITSPTVWRATTQLREALAAAEQRANDWKAAHDGAAGVIKDIGGILGADMPRELVTAVAYQRMEELATLRAENAHLRTALALSDALRNKERNLPL